MIKNFYFLGIAVFLLSCNNNGSESPISNIKYQIQLPDTFDIEIQYFSDKYFDSGKVEGFKLNSSTYIPATKGIWEAKRLQKDKKNGYFIQLKINQVNNFSGKLKMLVFVNDSILIDSTSYTKENKELSLSGDIPKTY